MVEHHPWVGSQYGIGHYGSKRIALVGHSHYEAEDDGADDNDDFTIEVVNSVIGGARLNFFTRIAKWFGAEAGALLEQVVFLNFLPERIGLSKDKYKKGTPQQYERAEARLLAVMEQHDVHKAIVFSVDLAERLPVPLQLPDGRTYQRLTTPPKHYYWHVYDINGRIVPMFVVPHPRFPVSNAEMEQVIGEIMSFPLPTPP